MSRFAVVLDANVMVPIAPFDTLLRLAEAGAFRPMWSSRILEEARIAVMRVHPEIDPGRVDHRFRGMNEAFEDALVMGWEPLVAGVELPDPNDRHVVAAAIRGRADAVVTNNTRDFPPEVLDDLGLEVITTDDFLLDQLELNPTATVDVIVEQAAAMGRPLTTPEQLLVRLSRGGAPRFAATVRTLLER